MGYTGASRKSPNDTAWETRKKLNRAICAHPWYRPGYERRTLPCYIERTLTYQTTAPLHSYMLAEYAWIVDGCTAKDIVPCVITLNTKIHLLVSIWFYLKILFDMDNLIRSLVSLTLNFMSMQRHEGNVTWCPWFRKIGNFMKSRTCARNRVGSRV